MDREEIDEFLCELFFSATDQKKEFFEGDKELYVYLNDNIDKDLQICIDGNYFNDILSATNFLKDNKNYKYVVTLNNDLDPELESEVPYKVYDLLSDENQVSENDLKKIVRVLATEYLNYNEDEDEDEQIIEYNEFLADENSKDIYERFCVDEMFGQELISSYFDSCDLQVTNINSIDISEIENSVNPNYSNGEITFINKIYRNIITDIYNYIVKTNDDEMASEFLISYLNDQIHFSEDFYKKYFGNTNIDVKSIVIIQKLLLISDYYKINQPYINQLDHITELDNNLIKLIQNNDIKTILKAFDSNVYFQERCISDFTNKEFYESSDFHTKSEDSKTLKKINPFYVIDKITKE